MGLRDHLARRPRRPGSRPQDVPRRPLLPEAVYCIRSPGAAFSGRTLHGNPDELADYLIYGLADDPPKQP